MYNCIFSDTDFEEVNFKNARLESVILINANFRNALLEGCYGMTQRCYTIMPNGEIIGDDDSPLSLWP